MSNGFFKELESMLDNEWISLTDVCALFAGFCPLEPFGGGWGFKHEGRRYKRISDGKEVKLSSADVNEMKRYEHKFEFVDVRAGLRYPNVIDGNDSEVSVRWAFKVGLGFRPLDEKITALYDAALDEGLILPEPSIPVDELLANKPRPPRLSQSPLQDNLIQLTKLESGLTAGVLFQRWEKVKPYYIDEIFPIKTNGEKNYMEYKFTYTAHSKKACEGDYDSLQKAIRRAYKYHSNPSK